MCRCCVSDDRRGGVRPFISLPNKQCMWRVLCAATVLSCADNRVTLSKCWGVFDNTAGEEGLVWMRVDAAVTGDLVFGDTAQLERLWAPTNPKQPPSSRVSVNLLLLILATWVCKSFANVSLCKRGGITQIFCHFSLPFNLSGSSVLSLYLFLLTCRLCFPKLIVIHYSPEVLHPLLFLH